jgi:hypothetical protein
VLEPAGDPSARETVRTTHHEQPRYIHARGAPKMVTPAPMLNHTDAICQAGTGAASASAIQSGDAWRRRLLDV